eukprot:gene44335-55138_t
MYFCTNGRRLHRSAFYGLDTQWLGFTTDTAGGNNHLTQHPLLMQDIGLHEHMTNARLLELKQGVGGKCRLSAARRAIGA